MEFNSKATRTATTHLKALIRKADELQAHVAIVGDAVDDGQHRESEAALAAGLTDMRQQALEALLAIT
jgi:hypothetical protein